MMPNQKTYALKSSAISVSIYTIYFILFTSSVSLIIYHYLQSDYFTYYIWADRDLYRAFQLTDVFQVFGSEMGGRNGQRIPGGALYYFHSAIQNFALSPLYIYMTHIILLVSGSLLLAWNIKCSATWVAGGIVFIGALGSKSVIMASSQLWNPFTGYIFCIFGTAFFVLYIRNRKPYALFSAFLLMFVAAQIHLSNITTVVGFVAGILYLEPTKWRQVLLSCIISGLVAYSPLIVHYALGANVGDIAMTGWEQSPPWLLHTIKVFLFKSQYIFSSVTPSQILLRVPTLAILIAATAWLLVNKRTGIQQNQERAGQEDIFKTTAVALGVALLVNDLGDPGVLSDLIVIGVSRPRYFLTSVPLTAVLVAVGILICWQLCRSSKAKVIVGVLSILLLMDLASNFAWIGLKRVKFWYANSTAYSDHNFRRYTFLKHVIDDVAIQYDMTSHELQSRVSFVDLKDGQLEGDVVPIEYLLRSEQIPVRSGESTMSECMMIIPNPDQSLSAANSKAPFQSILETLQNDGGLGLRQEWFQSAWLSVQPRYAIVFFGQNMNDCPRSTLNNNLLTPVEMDIIQHLDLTSKASSTPKKVLEGDGVVKYIGFFLFDPTYYPLTYMIEISQNETGLTARLHSKQLRNPIYFNSGYWARMTADTPELILIDDNGLEYRVPILNGVLGAGNLTSPWTANTVNIPSGTYKVSLVFKSLKQATLSKNHIEILLDKTFIVENFIDKDS